MLYSDGLIEARAPDGRPFGERRLLRRLSGYAAGITPEQVLEDIWAAFENHIEGQALEDDITLVVLHTT